MIILMGLPGCGKGTQSLILQKIFNINIVAPGIELRKQSQKNSKLKDILSLGQMAPNNIVDDIVFAKILQYKGKCIIDGYPRTPEQIISLRTLINNNNFSCPLIINIICSDTVLYNRLINRWICQNCHKSYNKNIICSACNINLVRRDDDHKTIINNRILLSKNLLNKVIKQWDNIPIYNINGDHNMDKITELLSLTINNNYKF